MTLTPARRSALIIVVSLVASLALTLGALRLDVFPTEGPIAAAAKRANNDEAQRTIDELEAELRKSGIEPPEVAPGEPMTAAQYRQALASFDSTAQADVLRAFSERSDEMESMADSFTVMADAYGLLATRLDMMAPPAAAVPLHQRLVDAYRDLATMARELGQDEQYEDRPVGDVSSIVAGRPELKEVWNATATIAQAGWVGADSDPDMSGMSAETKRKLEEIRTKYAEGTDLDEVGALRVD